MQVASLEFRSDWSLISMASCEDLDGTLPESHRQL